MWYLDTGGRIGKLAVAASPHHFEALGKAGFTPLSAFGAGTNKGGTLTPALVAELSKMSLTLVPSTHSLFVIEDVPLFKAHVERRIEDTAKVRAKLASGAGAGAGGGGGESGGVGGINEEVSADSVNKMDEFALNDILGRVMHDLGDAEGAIGAYTNALMAVPQSAAVFRNMGSAYQAVGNMQMAFASYQQAVQLDPSDAIVYLKLAFFYEDFATKDWTDASDHAQRCYTYYLDNVDAEDTGVLSRLGNLLVREHKSNEAIEIYNRILKLDEQIYSVWFNKAHAQVKIGDAKGAIESLQRTLALAPHISAAAHMLKALSDEEAARADSTDEKYIKELFDSYAPIYDVQTKKIMYSAPRVIRQEMAKIYRGRFTIINTAESSPSSAASVNADKSSISSSSSSSSNGNILIEDEIPLHLPSEGPGCTTIIPTIVINNTLDILDIGCGTGLAGKYFQITNTHKPRALAHTNTPSPPPPPTTTNNNNKSNHT